MTNVKKICDIIGTESYEALWDVVTNRGSYKELPEYNEMNSVFYNSLRKIDDKILKFEIEEEASEFSTVAMYQGFVLGFQEAVKLLIGGVNVT